jgi:hypothetical protein
MVEEKEEALTYHFDRTVNSANNFVEEAVIKEAGRSTITYECNATGHTDTMQIEPNPKVYEDILAIQCVRRHTIYATVDGKNFENVEEVSEENFYAKDQGMIQSTVNQCEYTRVDNNAPQDDGCTQKVYKIWAFVAD